MLAINLVPHAALDVGSISAFLDTEQIRRVEANDTDRDQWEDEVLIYNPREVFSIRMRQTIEYDLRFVKDRMAFETYRAEHNVPIIHIRRGGGIIWHGPGQLILEPFVDLRRLGITRSHMTRYTQILEETCIETLAAFGIRSIRNVYTDSAHGAWVAMPHMEKPCSAQGGKSTLKKIAFLGWRERHFTAIHGCALNVVNDLYPFSLIHPCNLVGIEATSMEEVLGKPPPIEDVAQVMLQIFIRLITAPNNI